MKKNLQSVGCAALLLLTMVAFGCSSHEPAPVTADSLKTQIVGKVWTLEEMFSREVTGDNPLTLEFKNDGTVTGFGGCNNLTGTYTLTGETLTFGPMASTRKSCGPVADEQEYSFQTFLATIKSVEVEDDELHLINPDEGVPMVFTSGGSGLFW